MSNIPAFTEHVELFGVKAHIFDPRSPEDIAAKIATIMDNPSQARTDADISKSALKKLTWEVTAREYLSIFQLAVENHKNQR
jgi:glycosyltransferase involved in cell wall biosynthesis